MACSFDRMSAISLPAHGQQMRMDMPCSAVARYAVAILGQWAKLHTDNILHGGLVEIDSLVDLHIMLPRPPFHEFQELGALHVHILT